MFACEVRSGAAHRWGGGRTGHIPRRSATAIPAVLGGWFATVDMRPWLAGKRALLFSCWLLRLVAAVRRLVAVAVTMAAAASAHPVRVTAAAMHCEHREYAARKNEQEDQVSCTHGVPPSLRSIVDSFNTVSLPRSGGVLVKIFCRFREGSARRLVAHRSSRSPQPEQA